MTRSLSSPAEPVRFVVRLTPKGGRDAIEGWQTDAAGRRLLKARVAAAPEDGKANAALIALLADELAVAKSKISIVAGETARVKTVQVESDSMRVTAHLAQLSKP